MTTDSFRLHRSRDHWKIEFFYMTKVWEREAIHYIGTILLVIHVYCSMTCCLHYMRKFQDFQGCVGTLRSYATEQKLKARVGIAEGLGGEPPRLDWVEFNAPPDTVYRSFRRRSSVFTANHLTVTWTPPSKFSTLPGQLASKFLVVSIYPLSWTESNSIRSTVPFINSN